MKRRVLIPIMLALLLLVALAPATFAHPLEDTIIGEGEVVNNDVVVLDGDLEVRTGAVVKGDVVVFNGDAIIDGHIEGSVTLFNGDLVAGEAAAVSGECVLLNGELSGSGSLGGCTAVKELDLPPLVIPEMPEVPELPGMPAMPEIAPLPTMPAIPVEPAESVMPVVPVPPGRHSDNTFGIIMARVASIVASSVLMGLLGLFVGAVMPDQLRRIVSTARNKTVVSAMAGVLTAIAVPSLMVLLVPLSILLTLVCIGLLGFPIILLLGLALVLGSFLGWVVVGTWLGIRVFGHGKDDRIVRAAGLGTALLTFAVGGLGFLPLFGGLILFVIAGIGLGAVALTQFGLKPFPRRPETTGGPDAGKVETVLNTLPPEENPA